MNDSTKPTPDQLARFAEFSRNLMAMTKEDFDIEELVVTAIAKASEKQIEEVSIDDAEDDAEALRAIAEMRLNPEYDSEILDEMERNYRSSMVPVTIPFPRSIYYGIACDTKQPPVSVGDVDLSGTNNLIIEAKRDQADRLIIQFDSTLPAGTQIVVPDHSEWEIVLERRPGKKAGFKLVLKPEETQGLMNMPNKVLIYLPDRTEPYEKVLPPRINEQN